MREEENAKSRPEFKGFKYIKSEIDKLCQEAIPKYNRSSQNNFSHDYTSLWERLKKEGYTLSGYNEVVRYVATKVKNNPNYTDTMP